MNQMSKPPAQPASAPEFARLEAGAMMIERQYGALTIEDAVRWAGFQENYAGLHFDREYVRGEPGLPTFIASGAYRESLMVRMLTDWIGARGRLARLKTRQMAPTFEGDSLHFTARIKDKSADPADLWVDCEVEGRNQKGQQILHADCRLQFQPGLGGTSD